MSTDDSPEREFEVYDSREGFPRATPEEVDGEGPPNASESEDSTNPSNSTEEPKSFQTPRREVWWLDIDAKNQSLESIKRRFEDFLNRFLSSSSNNSLLRHITSPVDNKLRHNLHQCPGYLREEITLTSDVSKSVIISHAFPSHSEVCSICGQLVQYNCTEPSIVDREPSSPNGSHHLPRLQPSGNPSPHSSIVGPSSPVLSYMSDSGSILIPPFPVLSSLGHPFMTTVQLRDNNPDENFGVSSLGVLNSDPFTRHDTRESLDTDSDSDFVAWGPPFATPSSHPVHFVPDDTHQLRDNKPEDESGLSPQNLFNPDRFRRRRKSSDVDSVSKWIPRDRRSLSIRLGRSGPSQNNTKPEENPLRFQKNSSTNTASSNIVIKTDGLNEYPYTKTTDHDSSPGGRRPLPGFLFGLATMLSRKSST